jgi:peptide deformylase
VLHEVAAPVRGSDDVLRAQVARMKRRLEVADGAGLAGTQVGFLRRVFVFRASLEDAVCALINPEVIAASEERSTFLEGCLSYQSVAVLVQRPVAVRVRAQDLDGRSLVLDVEGYRASLLQHEIDHLDGILTIDRADPDERRRVIGLLMGARSDRGDGFSLAA